MNEESTIIEKLNYLEGTKTSIKNAIISKGQEVTENDTFRSYAQKIANIETGIDTSDATATAEDIKAGKTAYVDGEKIEGTHVDEDLTSVLNAQDEKIAELEAALENKTAGANVKLNIFTQTTEPTNKNGLWLQTDKTAEHYKSDDSIYFGGSWSNSGDTANIPYNFYQGAAVNIGENIYIFGGSGKNQYAYKYDTLTNAYTKLANIPFSFESGSAVVVGTDIYLLSGIWDTYVYKYNTLTNTYARLADIPYGEFYNGAAIAVGTDIFMFGGSNNVKAVYKYDTLNDTYTRLTDMTYGFSYGAAVSVGTDIYLLGNGYSSNYYKYAYKYNTLTDTYTQLTNIPFNFYKGSATSVGTDIFIFGGEGNNTATRIYHIQTKTYNTDNTVIIAQGRAGIGKTYNSGYAVELFDTTFDENFQPLYGLVDAWFYTTQDGVITTIPTYYGNGTQWIKFKN